LVTSTSTVVLGNVASGIERELGLAVQHVVEAAVLPRERDPVGLDRAAQDDGLPLVGAPLATGLWALLALGKIGQVEREHVPDVRVVTPRWTSNSARIAPRPCQSNRGWARPRPRGRASPARGVLGAGGGQDLPADLDGAGEGVPDLLVPVDLQLLGVLRLDRSW
jgi:hypothetical protein